MAHVTAEKFAQRAFDFGLLDERQLQEVWASLGSRNVATEELLQLLVRREFLTNYQVERLRKGDRGGYFYGPYKVLYHVGAGTFARVYRAAHRETGQVVALKVLRSRFSDSPAQFGQFVREGQVGYTLRHPNIVPIYEVVSQGKTHFFVMEFVEGWNLRDLVKIRKMIAPAEAIRMMTDLTEGLRYAFEHGVTHRDLKLSNVLVSSRGQAKLVDFGLAAMDETLTEEALADMPNARTIDYAALERVTGVRKDDTRSDIYFAGCILYHMLTGQAPLSETRDRLQRLSRSRFQQIVPIRKLAPGLPDSLMLVVNKSMSLDPMRRYQTPAAMLADLHIAARRVAEVGKQGGAGEEQSGSAGETDRRPGPAQEEHSVMVVESNAKMQEVFRQGFKRAGYRVLLTVDPMRAVARFRQDPQAAECVVFNAQELGQAAVESFNHLGEDKKTHLVPAVLLLDASQKSWSDQAQTSHHRAVLTMPLTMKQLRQALARIVAEKAAGGRE
jgi:eukaryotic-like serine/threonine-protein kinase